MRYLASLCLVLMLSACTIRIELPEDYNQQPMIIEKPFIIEKPVIVEKEIVTEVPVTVIEEKPVHCYRDVGPLLKQWKTINSEDYKDPKDKIGSVKRYIEALEGQDALFLKVIEALNHTEFTCDES